MYPLQLRPGLHQVDLTETGDETEGTLRCLREGGDEEVGVSFLLMYRISSISSHPQIDPALRAQALLSKVNSLGMAVILHHCDSYCIISVTTLRSRGGHSHINGRDLGHMCGHGVTETFGCGHKVTEGFLVWSLGHEVFQHCHMGSWSSTVQNKAKKLRMYIQWCCKCLVDQLHRMLCRSL